MKNFFKNFRSYKFWVSFAGALIIFLNVLGRVFGFSIENQIVEDVILSFASILVVLGIVTKTENDIEDDEKIDKESCVEDESKKDYEDENDMNK